MIFARRQHKIRNFDHVEALFKLHRAFVAAEITWSRYLDVWDNEMIEHPRTAKVTAMFEPFRVRRLKKFASPQPAEAQP